MTRDDRFYSFIVARTSSSRSCTHRISVHKRWLKLCGLLLFVGGAGLIYGFYGLTQQAEHLRIELENRMLRAENEKQREELLKLDNRLEAVENTSRKLAEISGVVANERQPSRGQGGPERPVDSARVLAALENQQSAGRSTKVSP